MKAIILAAGYGNRMRPLTDSLHKTMLVVAGKTIIGRIIGGLVENAITDITVVTGYRADELSAYLTAGFRQVKFTFVHNEKYRETNNIYSMARAFEAITIDSDIILIESDLIYHPEIITRLIKSPHENVALVDKYRHGMDGTVVAVKENRITDVIPPHLQPGNFDFSDKYKTLNIYKFSKEFCETSFKKLLIYYANVIDRNCYYELILGILIYMQREIIHAEIVEGETWSEVDDPNDLQVAEFAFNSSRKEILESNFGGYWNYDVLDFCFIRNMYFPNSSIISELRNSLPDLIHNYGSRQTVLDRKMSWFLLSKEANTIALNGASQIYPLVQSRFGSRKALIPAPSFGEYRRIFDDHATYNDSIGFDTAEIERKTDAGAEVIAFVNPNDPTGSFLPTEWIYAFAERHIDRMVIVDESFIEFAGVPSILPMLEDWPLKNVLVIKSLSKSLGVPGIRLGYAYSCDEELTSFLRGEIPIWNMNSIAEHYLEIILKHRNSLNASFARTVNDRTAFSELLAGCPVIERVFESAGNFLLVQLKDSPASDRLALLLLSKHAIYVKDVTDKFLNGRKYLRLAVRLPQENERLVEAIQEISGDENITVNFQIKLPVPSYVSSLADKLTITDY